jgi:hypothetical protein
MTATKFPAEIILGRGVLGSPFFVILFLKMSKGAVIVELGLKRGESIVLGYNSIN